MRAPFVLPRKSDQFSFVAKQKLEIPCMMTIPVGGRKANTRYRNGCKRRDGRVTPPRHEMGPGPAQLFSPTTVPSETRSAIQFLALIRLENTHRFRETDHEEHRSHRRRIKITPRLGSWA